MIWCFQGVQQNPRFFKHLWMHGMLTRNMLTKNPWKFRCQIWRKCYHLLSSRAPLFHACHPSTSYMLRHFDRFKIPCFIWRKCYHFVIIVIDNKKNKKHACWCLFLSFFWAENSPFFVHFFMRPLCSCFSLTYYIN